MAGENLTQDNDSAVAVWDGLRSSSDGYGDPGFMVGDSDRRARFVQGLRELANFLESRPEIPVPYAGETIMSFADGTTAEKFAQVDYAGRLLDVPVTDDTARGGHLYAERRFGPVAYGFFATGVGAAFAVGQDVRLAEDQSIETENAGLALAGTVTGLRQETDGTYSYTVRFPGHHGTREGMTGDQLQETKSPAIRLRDGSVMSIKDAEEFLIDATARYSLGPKTEDAATKEKFRDVTTGLAAACGINVSALIRQLEPKTGQRELELAAGKTSSAAAVAAKDNPGPYMISLANAVIDMPGHSTAPPAPRRAGPRP